ncbi:MAG TPA: hypothetical protein VFL91_30685 [Thermomicrobiales bacterium]|nr:hypothetical protein [Thermomicrobiales bacterium]
MGTMDTGAAGAGGQRRGAGGGRLYAAYLARAGPRATLTPTLFALQVEVETRRGRALDEAFWADLLAAPDHLLPATAELLARLARGEPPDAPGHGMGA